jgi:cell division protein ZapA
MGQVNVTISGKLYRMACEDGEEEHLERLADRLNRTIERLREEFGEIGDQRLTVMAAITMADQTSEHEHRLQHLEAEVTGLEEAEMSVAHAIETVAARLESLAARLNGGSHHGNGSQ